MLRFWKKRKRRELQETSIPRQWAKIVAGIPLCAALSPADREELHGHIQVFLAEKRFEGCNGLEVTDEIRVTIAAQACVLLLHRDTDYYPTTQTVMVYPDEFAVDVVEMEDDFVVSEYIEDRAGESWDYGPVILSWKDVVDSLRQPDDGYNVVLHEFAHQLDLENGSVDGSPKLADADAYARWQQIFTKAFEKHRDAAEKGRITALDPYAAEGPGEFFAVVVETFFEIPNELQRIYPDIYSELSAYFQQDPRVWNPA